MTALTIKIGTRGSALALWQAEWVRSLLLANHPELLVELVIIKTQGDKILDVPLAKVGGKGLFVKELEEALLAKEIDLAVHSMKDMPALLPQGLALTAILEREDPRDVLLSSRYTSLHALPQQATVGSSSLRRQSQLLHLRPDLQIVSLRGNVNTRINKLINEPFDAIVLAAAGVKRLQLTQYVVEYLDPQQIIPANGQGAIGIESREDDQRLLALLAPLNHQPTWLCVRAERAFLATLEGGCQVPIAGHATLNGQQLHLLGRIASLDGQEMITLSTQGPAEDPVSLGVALAHSLLEQGGQRILQQIGLG
ncbi:hydroxymethylbilane synthase [Candidatus Magnetaquicoccus inordinatus]|uniref:hydroxymethylbilane synthase n=1 Tax=Candidatus Magnetaquicoccus inordinatus TaxID=2496818 RepID=UPI00102D0CE6|nr:hydroxymethylbilane synthase [Candidatus Magnetaquicoccus inordinatus]